MLAAAGEETAFPADAVEVGRVLGAWGVKGGLRIKPFSADPQALFSTKRWYLQPPLPPAGATVGPRPASRPAAKVAPQLAWPLLLHVVQAREQGEHIVATARDLDDRDAAEALSGARIFIPRASFPTPAEDEFYWVDLIGLGVRNREGTALGTVIGLMDTGPTCVLRVQAPAPPPAEGDPPVEAEECLIPFVSAYVDRVDLPGRCILVDWQSDY
ncbi:MAG: ribosome maturation factor RimM [Rubrivivax sp.]|nr:ribosome maturation factor RimM [Rubrivivax sp.]